MFFLKINLSFKFGSLLPFFINYCFNIFDQFINILFCICIKQFSIIGYQYFVYACLQCSQTYWALWWAYDESWCFNFYFMSSVWWKPVFTIYGEQVFLYNSKYFAKSSSIKLTIIFVWTANKFLWVLKVYVIQYCHYGSKYHKDYLFIMKAFRNVINLTQKNNTFYSSIWD